MPRQLAQPPRTSWFYAILLVGVIVLGAISRGIPIAVTHRSPSRTVSVGFMSGAMMLFMIDGPDSVLSVIPGMTPDEPATLGLDLSTASDLVAPVYGVGWRTLSFAPPRYQPAATLTGIGMNLWLVGALLGVLAIREWRRNERIRYAQEHGLCPACGYDLRATPDRCPECGRIVGTPQS